MKHRSLSQHLAALAMLLMALTPLLTACVDEDEYADTPAGNFEALWRILDEHYYEPNSYFLKSRQYDKYPRNRKTKVYLGEYAAKDKKLIDALAEGLYLLHVERNGDVVCMTSYAPLFARKEATNWNPDLIYFDNERPYLTCSYYVQQMFGQSAGQYYYGDCVSFGSVLLWRLCDLRR